MVDTVLYESSAAYLYVDSGWAWPEIVLGIIAALIALICLIYFFWRCRKNGWVIVDIKV